MKITIDAYTTKSDDIHITAEDITPLQAIVLFMEAGKLVAQALGKTVSNDLGFALIKDKDGSGEFVEDIDVLKDNMRYNN